MNELVSSTQQ